jgi:hypothetical protein
MLNVGIRMDQDHNSISRMRTYSSSRDRYFSVRCHIYNIWTCRHKKSGAIADSALVFDNQSSITC